MDVKKKKDSSSSSSINELNKMIAALMENSSVLDNQVKSLTEENRTLKEKLGTLKEKLGTLKLKKLSCKNTGFTLIGLTHFLAAVEKNPILVEIHMENNKLDEKGCEVLNKFVKGKNKGFYKNS